MPKHITAKDAELAWISAIPRERLSLTGVKLGNNPQMPSLKIARIAPMGVELALALRPKKWIHFEGYIPSEHISQLVDLRALCDINTQAIDGIKNIRGAFILAGIMDMAHLTVIRNNLRDPNAVNVVLACGNAYVAFSSTIDNLSEFIEPDAEKFGGVIPFCSRNQPLHA